MAVKPDPRIDAYIAEAEPFARPILKHLRRLVRRACPEVEETMKWSSPFFLYRGRILCFVAAFKAHTAFGFWGPAMKKIVARDNPGAKAGRGLMGRLTSVRDLPADPVMLGYLRTARKIHDTGAPLRPKPKPRPALPVPADLAAALKSSRRAAANWEAFAPSHRREYIEWITEARRPETRTQRLKTTLQWVVAGKARNWKYQDC
jgi:uncharacterized protein YdeI (YjbR/CyaY-like superfamily)